MSGVVWFCENSNSAVMDKVSDQELIETGNEIGVQAFLGVQGANIGIELPEGHPEKRPDILL